MIGKVNPFYDQTNCRNIYSLAGVKLGGVAAVGGSILGYTGACVIKEQKDIRKHIDDHYKNEPKLYVLTPKEEAVLARRRASLKTHQSVDRSSLKTHQSVDYLGEEIFTFQASESE